MYSIVTGQQWFLFIFNGTLLILFVEYKRQNVFRIVFSKSQNSPQRYKNILNYANENAKNVRKICKKVQNLTESKGRAYKYARHRRYYRWILWSRCPDIIRT